MNIYSYHNFMFPFRWEIKGLENETFSEQINLKNIRYAVGSNWTRCFERPVIATESDNLYNERNYFYEFVHDALYDNGNDNSLVRHYERNETKHGDVVYIIDCGEKGIYQLKVFAINLNLYSTGVGVLSFFLYNEKYQKPEDVLRINQAGRRVFPPFLADLKKRSQIAHRLEIRGLHGRETGYVEDFSRYTNKTKSNTPASFITDLVTEVAENIVLKPVIDDRMFVQCWYKNDEWTNRFSGNGYEKFRDSSDWYEFVFVDNHGDLSCQNDGMLKEIIEKATYERWQKYGSLYGVSRYSMVYLTNFDCPDFLTVNFETMYARMAELVLVQKASVLRFSAEVTNLSNMEEKRGFSEKVSSLYKEYIRFVNQIHFREVSAQDQGIELYQKLYDVMNLGNHVKMLDEEIEELYNYVSLSEGRKSNNTMELLSWIATISVPMTMVAGFFGMNNRHLGDKEGILNDGFVQFMIAVVVTVFVIGVVVIKNRRKKK